MWAEAQTVTRVFTAHDKNRLGHVQRDQRQTSRIRRVIPPGRGCALAMIEQITPFEDKVVLVPEPLTHIAHARGLDRCLVDRVMVGLRPFSDQLKRLPVVVAFLGIRRNPGVLFRCFLATALCGTARQPSSRSYTGRHLAPATRDG